MASTVLPAFVLLVSSTATWGQTVVSLSAQSDYRFRGVSLSNGRADLGLSLDYDHAGGCYAGASVTAVEFLGSRRQAQWLGYGGCARPLGDGVAAEAGVTLTKFARDGSYDYGEGYAGLIAPNWNLRTYLSPSYFGSSARTAYLEVNAAVPLVLPWRLIGHLGALWRVGGAAAESGPGRRDARLGVATAIGDWQWQLAWIGGRAQGVYPVSYSPPRQAWVLSSTLPF